MTFMTFNPSRLILARKRRGKSKTGLAKESGISHRSLVYHETGEVEPSEETLNTLASVLKFPVEFFFKPDVDEISSDAASFRALKKMTASQEAVAIAAGTISVEFEQWIDKHFDLPKSNLPLLRGVEPETAAEMLRAKWSLGQRPIKNMIHLVEAHGVRVFSLPIESANVDAFSLWHDRLPNDQTPFIFLNSTKTGERRRFDIAHELGHLVLHRHGSPPNRQAEFEADRFGSAFLMPKADVLAHIPRGFPSERHIHAMKRRWKVAAIAMVVRLWHLDMLTEWQYRSLCISLSEAGYRTSEPDGIPSEQSQVLTKVLEVLRSDGTTRQSVARQLAITAAEFNSLIAGLAISSVPILGSISRESNADEPPVREWPALEIVPQRKIS
jgi:Zn-dependent peptidase ImmA (M78 family)/DNA-binding XRE family transcriptional regulator